MNLSDSNYFTFTKQLKDDGKKKRDENRARENIINTMVNQEVKCYDLRYQIQILEEKNKNQKEEMVIIQTESEALSKRLDDEIRYRTESMNKVNNYRKLYDILEKNFIELRETLSKCLSDIKALSLMFEKCTQKQKALKEELKKREQQAKDTISILEQKLQYQTESEKKMLEGFNCKKSFLKGQLKVYKDMLLKSKNTIMALCEQKVELEIQKQEFEKDYGNTPPPKHRRRLGPTKSSVNKLKKELKTKKKRSKKSAV